MNIIKWKKEFETGFDVIDFQHKIVLSRGNEIMRELNNGNSKYIIEILLKDLIDYLFNHFNFEENLFDFINYTNIENHLIEHQYFRDKLISITNKFLNDEKNIEEDLILFLNEWINTHILITDKNFGNDLKKYLNLE